MVAVVRREGSIWAIGGFRFHDGLVLHSTFSQFPSFGQTTEFRQVIGKSTRECEKGSVNLKSYMGSKGDIDINYLGH